MHHGLRMAEQQAPYRIDILDAVTVDAIGIPQKMNGKLAVAVRLGDRRDTSLQKEFDHAEITSTTRVVEGGILLQINRV